MRDPKRIYSHVHSKTQIVDLLDCLEYARPDWKEALDAVRLALGENVPDARPTPWAVVVREANYLMEDEQ